MLLLDCEQWCKAHGLTLAELEKRGWDVASIGRTAACSRLPTASVPTLRCP